MSAIVIIPARYASTRFPAKMLASETGRPLVQHVVDQVKQCRKVARVLVATDDRRIVDALAPFGTECRMTSPDHPSGTDRLAEVARTLDHDIIVNVQGDEPEIEPAIIDALVERMETGQDDMATCATAFAEDTVGGVGGGIDADAGVGGGDGGSGGGGGVDVANPNLVKVVVSQSGQALYFSRSVIPHQRDTNESKPGWLLHLGIYAYRREFLLRFAGWSPTPLERAEKLEQLRALEYGSKLFVLKVNRAAHGIDTPEQYRRFVQRHRAGGGAGKDVLEVSGRQQAALRGTTGAGV
jgi:3-deoxy-manno-octulosonate cytidylyltransferase (CMP-KDO synthetase)